MLEVRGTYQDGYVKLDRKLSVKSPSKVIITFLDDAEIINEDITGLKLSDFSFNESREMLKSFQGSFSDTVVEERRAS